MGVLVNSYRFGGAEGGQVFTTNFSEYTTGAAPGDWSQYAAPGTFTITTSGALTGGKVLRSRAASSSVVIAQWDAVPDATEMECLVQMRITGFSVSGKRGGPLLRVDLSTVTLAEASVRLQTAATDPDTFNNLIAAYEAGLTTESATDTVSYTSNSWIYIRFKATGDTFRMRRWTVGLTEPATWDLEITEVGMGPGGFGIRTDETSTYYLDVRYISVGIGGAVPLLV